MDLVEFALGEAVDSEESGGGNFDARLEVCWGSFVTKHPSESIHRGRRGLRF